MKTEVFILFIFLFFVGCVSNEKKSGLNEKENIIKWEDFGKLQEIKLQKVTTNKKIYASKIYLNDSLLYFLNGDSPDYFVTVTDLNGNIINRVLRKGNGPNEVMSVSFLRFLKNNLIYAYDGYMFNILRVYNKLDFQRTDSPKAIKLIDMGAGLKKIIAVVNSNRFILDNIIKNRFKVDIVDSNFNLLKHIGKYDIKDFNKTNTVYIKTAYSKYVEVNQSGNRFALAYSYIDVIEIYDMSGNQIFNGYGPLNISLYNFNPDKIKNQIKVYGLHDSISKFAYIAITSSKKYIYTLFSGKIVASKDDNCSRKILVFDWNGNPVKYLYLSEPISTLAIDEKNNILYGYNSDNNVLYKAKLDF